MRTHETYMRRCLELGRMALEAGTTGQLPTGWNSLLGWLPEAAAWGRSAGAVE